LDTTTGATPGAGATPAQAGQQEPTTQPPAGATPQAGTTATAAATSPATGDEALGDAGKRILAEARREAKEATDRAKAAEAERDALKAATLTDQEKAIAAARKEAIAEADAKWLGHVRRVTVRQALTAAGISQSELDLAANAPEFGALKVSDEGVVEDIGKTVDAFKASHPSLFASTGARTGSGDLGFGGGHPAGQPTYTREQLRDPAFFAANRADILKAQNEGRISG
jgi:hypothetical protein